MELKERVGNNIGSGLEDLFREFGNKGNVYWVYNKNNKYTGLYSCLQFSLIYLVILYTYLKKWLEAMKAPQMPIVYRR